MAQYETSKVLRIVRKNKNTVSFSTAVWYNTDIKERLEEVVAMKIIITTKNFNASDALKETIEKKLGKLDKYFSDEINANVKLSSEGSRDKLEATISNKGTSFRESIRTTRTCSLQSFLKWTKPKKKSTS